MIDDSRYGIIKNGSSGLLPICTLALLGGGGFCVNVLLDLGCHFDSLFEGDDDCLAALGAAGDLEGTGVCLENRKLRFLFHLIIIQHSLTSAYFHFQK